MICPVELAHEMSAFRWRHGVDLPAGGRHGFLSRVRRGAGDESTGSDFASDGQEDHLVAGGGDYRHQRPPDAALVSALPGVWLRRTLRPAPGPAEPEARAGGDGRARAGALPREVLRSERAALSREARRAIPDSPQLQLGEEGAAGRRAGEEGASAGHASPPAAAAAAAGDAAAPGRQPASLVSR